MIFFLCFTFFHKKKKKKKKKKNRLRPKNTLNPCALLAAFWQYTYILGDLNDIKSNA